MARTQTNTQNNTKTRKTRRRNRHSQNTIFCVFRILLFIYNFLNDFSKKCWLTALVRSLISQIHFNNSILFIYHAHYLCILFGIHEHVIDMVKNICSVKTLFCGIKHHALSDDIGKEFSVSNAFANVPKTKRQMAKMQFENYYIAHNFYLS